MSEVARLVPGPHPGVARTIPVPPAPVAFAFGGGRAALGYGDGRLRVVDLGTGAMLIDVQSEAAPVQVLALSGRWLVAGVGDRIEVWDTITGNRLAVHPPHPDHIVALGIEPDRKWVASVDRRSPGVRVADLRTGVELGVIGRIYPVVPADVEPPEERELALRTALAAFAAFRIMHADVGAADDHVEQTLHEIVRAAWVGDADLVALGVTGWELTPGPMAEVAAERLDGAAALVDAAVRAITPEERDRLQAFVQAEAWRVDLERVEGDVGCHAVGWLPDGHLVVEHDDAVAIWDLSSWSAEAEDPVHVQVASMAGTLFAVEGDQVLVVDPLTEEVRSWQVFTGLVRSEPLPRGRLIPSRDSVDEVVVVDDATLTVVRFGDPARRIPAGIGRLGTVVARLGDDLVAASLATLRVCPFDRLEVDDPRAGLPIHALAVHPEGRFVAVVRVLDDHDDMQVERWDPPDPALKLLPGAVPLVREIGVDAAGRIRAGGRPRWSSADPPGVSVRVWGPGSDEEPLDEAWQAGVLTGRWVHAGDLLRDLESDEVRHGPPPSPDRVVVVRADDLVVVGEDGLVVFASDGVTVGHTERWSLRPVRSAHLLPDHAVLIVFADGGVAGWSDLTGVVEPWFVPPVVDAAVTGDGRIAFGVVDAGPQEAARAWVELWDGTLRDPVRSGMWPASGAGVVVAAAGSFLAYGDPTGQVVLLDLRDA